MTFPFVNVPQVLGVPSVNFAPFVQPQLLLQDLVSQFSAVFGPQWGIFQNGLPIITAESVTGFEFRADWTISDYPVEGGVFESYDKVTAPFLAKVRFASGRSPQARNQLLSNIDAVAGLSGVPAGGQLPIYDIVTPEFTYIGCSISHYDYKREAHQGVGLIVVDVWVSQVLVQSAAGLSAAQVQNPASADPQHDGQVQAIPNKQVDITLPNTGQTTIQTPVVPPTAPEEVQ
jgi:hypothetical protein